MVPLLIGRLGSGDGHETGSGHPERRARLSAADQGLRAARLGDAAAMLEPRVATVAELARVHDGRYLTALAALADAGGGDLDPDTAVVSGSWVTAAAAAGLGLAAVDALRAGHGEAAFVLARPPGHHATATRGMGFCLLNNVAVAAAELVEAGERVLILDWDVHHGNGTQDIFWDDPHVLYVSLHEWPAYPGSGAAHETGGPNASGATINIPLPCGATGDVARLAIERIVAPAADAFGPTWVLVSAGFDAHRDDPLGGLGWSSGDFADLARDVGELAPRSGRTIAFLEGGYDLNALADSVGATAAALAGLSYRPEGATSGGPGRRSVADAADGRAHVELEGRWT